jgi:hypothetical protein
MTRADAMTCSFINSGLVGRHAVSCFQAGGAGSIPVARSHRKPRSAACRRVREVAPKRRVPRSCHNQAMSRRRSFGAVRRLPANRWQARYRGDDGRLHSAPGTFAGRVDAERFLAQMDLERVRGGWVGPEAGAVPLATYVFTRGRRRPPRDGPAATAPSQARPARRQLPRGRRLRRRLRGNARRGR